MNKTNKKVINSPVLSSKLYLRIYISWYKGGVNRECSHFTGRFHPNYNSQTEIGHPAIKLVLHDKFD